MKPVSNFNPNNANKSAREQLPVGNYAGRILGAKEENGQYGAQLVIQFEITEGEYAGFFKKDYEAQVGSPFGQKYHGVLRLNEPVNDGSEFDGYRIAALERFVNAVERSNKGYVWDWDEKGLKGKNVGIMVREHTKTFDDGRENTWTEIGSCCPVDAISTTKTLKAKVEKRKEPVKVTAAESFKPVEEDDDLPF